MANQPSLIPSAWAANNSTTETIPATTTESGKASWDQGFPVETSLPLSEGGIPPKYGDFNGILNVLSQFALFAQSGGQYAWSNTLDYGVGSVVLGTDGSIYRAAQVSGPSTTAVNPVGDTSGKWERIVSKSDIDALEADIQTAMSTASDAASNASAAQSAVTTLDANVVKLSGNQTVGGTKTFSDGIVVAGTQSLASIKSTSDASLVRLGGGTDGKTTTGAVCMLGGINNTTYPGKFLLFATNGSSSKVLSGAPDGTLTWDSKDIITNGGDQTVGGEKTFTKSTNIKLVNPYLNFVETDVERGTAPSGVTGYQGIYFRDKNEANFGGIIFNLQVSSSKPYGDIKLIHTGNASTDTTHTILFRENTSSAWYFMPDNTNDINLGGSSHVWKQLYAGTTTIATSDERQKSNVSSIPDAVLDAWGDVNWQQFQFNDALAEKGESARIHSGLIAQRIASVFEAHGLDASRYGIFCYDEWEAEDEQRDEDGNVISPAREAGNAYALRYEEALCMEAAYQRRRADRAEARITSLEQRLAEMEAALASLISPVEAEDLPYVAQEQENGE